MKKILFYIIILSVVGYTPKLLGQCQPDDVLTNPDITGGWDWRVHPITVFEHIKATGVNQTSPFSNPFYDLLNLNTGFLAQEGPAPNYEDLRDYKPEDGWELIYKEVGDEITPGRGVTHPVIILYNKFRGVMRVFINISDKDDSYNGAVIKLEILNDQTTRSASLVGNANLSLSSPIAQPLDAFTHTQSMVKINQWEEQDDYWLFAEFPIGYDPCVCLYESRFYVAAALIKGGTLEWVSGGKTPTTKKIVDNGKDEKSLKETYETVSEFVTNVSKAATSNKKSTTEIVNAITSTLKLIASTNPPTIDTTGFDTTKTPSNETVVKAITKIKKSEFKAPEWLKSIPKIGAVIGVVDFLLTGPEDNKTATVGTEMIKTTGSIDFKTKFRNVTPIAPGAQKGTTPHLLVPEYNNPLGVFNLLETPQLEYVEYQPNVKQIKYEDYNGSILQTIQFPTVREYFVSEDLKYILNPHAEVEIVNMDVSLVYIPKIQKVAIPCTNDKTKVTPMNASIYGPFELGRYDGGLSYNNRLFLSDVVMNYGPDTNDESIKDAIYSTPIKSPDCFKYAHFKVFHWDNLGETEIKCKIQLTLKPINSDEEFFMVLTYPVQTKLSEKSKIQDIVTIRDDNWNIISTTTSYRDRKYHFENVEYFKDYDFALRTGGAGVSCQTNFPIESIDPSPFSFFDNNYNIPSNIIVSNVHLTNNQELKAWNSVIIGKDVTAEPNVKLTVQAGSHIDILSDANIDFDFETKLEMPGSCPVVSTVSEDNVNDFCVDKKYKGLSVLKRALVENEIQDENYIKFTTYPIPFQSQINLDFEIEKGAKALLVLYNALGQEIDVLIDNEYIERGKHEFQYDGSHLPPGIYFATLQSTSGDKPFKKTIKLIKQ